MTTRRGSRWGRAVLRTVLDTVLPRLCPGCDRELLPRQWICFPCRRRFRPVPSGAVCFLCREEERGSGDREAGFRCRRGDHRSWRGGAVFWMEDPIDRVIHAFKYENRPDLSRPLGRLLATGVDPGPFSLVLAVPLHRQRLRARGYNQAARLARVLARRRGLPFLDEVVGRKRATLPQARLEEGERGANMAGAFRVDQPILVRGRRFLVVDDVATTGSTLMELSRTLYDEGAVRVAPLVLALA